MTDRGAVATARAVGERLADDIRRMHLADILRLPELELPDRKDAVKETGAALRRLPDRDLSVLAEAMRGLPRKVRSMEPITVPHDAPIPDRVVDALPFLERERRTSALVPTIAVISIVGFVVALLVVSVRRATMRADAMARSGAIEDATLQATPAMPGGTPLAPTGGTTSVESDASGMASTTDPARGLDMGYAGEPTDGSGV